MDIKLLKKYLEICNQLKALPNWKRLNSFKRVFK